MTTWVIGDIHGCVRTLGAILDRIDPQSTDRFYFLGDFLNKGPDGPGVIRLIKSLHNVRYVLGNHDLHNIAAYYGCQRSPERAMGCEQLNRQPDKDALWEWLLSGELILVDDQIQLIAVHAGIWPQWNIDDIKRIQVSLGDYSWQRILQSQTDNIDKPIRLGRHQGDIKDIRDIVTVCTNMRYMDIAGDLLWDEFRWPPVAGSVPWFDVQHNHGPYTVFFGHWAAITGLKRKGFVHLDGGVAYGRSLMAYAVEEATVFEQIRLDGDET